MGKKSKLKNRRQLSVVSLSIYLSIYFFVCVFRRAKLLLKKKRYLESLLDKTDTQIDNLQQMVETIEYTQIEIQVVEGLKEGNECLEAMHKVCVYICLNACMNVCTCI